MSLTHKDYIRDYLDFLKFQKRYSEHTLVSYETDLRAYLNFLSETFQITDINLSNSTYIRSWLASMKEKGITSKTINRKISSLKSYFKFQLKNQVITGSPMATIISPKSGKRLPQYVEKEDMKTLFAHVEFDEGFAGKTQRLIMMLFYNTGIRQAELIGLKEKHIDISNKAIKVLGKGSKERIIPVGDDLIKEIREYLSEKALLPSLTDQEVLLVNIKGKMLYPKYVYAVVKRYLSLVTTIEKRSPHILRHTFATHLTGSGADLNAVKELLGHSSLAATQVYTHNNIQKLKDIHKKAHPKA